MTEAEVQAVSTLARSSAPVEVVHVRKDAVTGETHLADPDGAIHRAFAADRALAVWIRPDKYVGFRGDPRATGPLASWLHSLFPSPQEQHHE